MSMDGSTPAETAAQAALKPFFGMYPSVYEPAKDPWRNKQVSLPRTHRGLSRSAVHVCLSVLTIVNTCACEMYVSVGMENGTPKH